MPQTPTTYMLLVQPTEGGDDDVWDTLYTALFLLVDAHDHTTGKGKPLGSASLVIDAALNLRDFDAINVGGIEFTPLGALPSSGYVNRFFGYAGDAWWRNSAGTNVQITSGGTLNMTTVGGIAGQYTSVGAEVAFVDASDSYTFKQQVGAAVRQYARLEAADLRLYEFKAHPAAAPPTTFVGLASPAALAGSYTLTMPAALPGSTQLLQVSSAGAITASNTVANGVLMASTLAVSGLISAVSGLTAGVNQDVTVSGTGDYNHGSFTKSISPFAGNGSGHSLGAGFVQSTGVGSWFIPLDLRVGDRLTFVDVWYFGNGVANVTISVTHFTSAAVATSLGSVLIPAPVAAWATQPFNVADTTLVAGDTIVVEFAASAAGIRVGPPLQTWDHP